MPSGIDVEEIDRRTRRVVFAALRHLISITGADAASVWCRDRLDTFAPLIGAGEGANELKSYRIPHAPRGFSQGRPFLVPSALAKRREISPQGRKALRKSRMKAFASFPIGIGGKPQALLAVAFGKPHDFPKVDVGYMSLVASQIGSFVEGALLLNESRSRERALGAYADIAALVAHSLELGNVLRSIAYNAQRIVDASNSFIYLAQPDGSLVGAASSREWEKRFIGSRIEPNENAVVQWARRRRRTEVVENAATDPRFSRRLGRLFGTKSMMATPLIARGRQPLGVLAIIETRGPRRFTREQVRRLETLANHAAAALDHAATHAELRERERELRILSRRLADAHESERRRISRELHDVVGQGLTAASLELAAFERTLTRNGTSLEPMRKILRETTTAARRLSAELHPAILDDLGLVPALRFFTSEFGRRTGLDVRFEEPAEIAVTDEASFILYRAAQEGLSNVLRHSGARRVWLRLRRSGRWIRLEVEDDGKGPPAAGGRRYPGVGLIAIRERASGARGRSSLSRGRRGGARLMVELPLSPRRKKGTANPRTGRRQTAD